MDAKTAQLIEQAKQSLTSLGVISSRSQFGGYGLTVNRVMFAIVCEGELYLRANRNNYQLLEQYLQEKFIFTKRGRPVELNYYRVTDPLWHDQAQLLHLAQIALTGAMQQQQAMPIVRLKDLPNLGYQLEQLLWKVGICDIETLHRYGAKRSYLKLKQLKSALGCHVLLALQGAIIGYHQAALPKSIRDELISWHQKQLSRKQVVKFSRLKWVS